MKRWWHRFSSRSEGTAFLVTDDFLVTRLVAGRGGVASDAPGQAQRGQDSEGGVSPFVPWTDARG